VTAVFRINSQSRITAYRQFASIMPSQNDAAAAIEILRPHQNCDFAFTNAFSEFYPVHIRSLAYFQNRQDRLAAAEVQKVLDNPGITQGFVIGAPARLQPARAQAIGGDEVAA